jgi:hypothetical protein
VNDCLERTFEKTGMPLTIIKDEGSDIKKGTEQYRTTNKCKKEMKVVQDIGHIIANAMKLDSAEFSFLPEL